MTCHPDRGLQSERRDLRSTTRCDAAHSGRQSTVPRIAAVNEHRYLRLHHGEPTHVFYVGVTNNLDAARPSAQRARFDEGFTARYNVDRLVWYEVLADIRDAIAREKQIKPWRREKKIRLIESLNPTWQDLSEDWGKPIQPLRRPQIPPLRFAPVGMTIHEKLTNCESGTWGNHNKLELSSRAQPRDLRVRLRRHNPRHAESTAPPATQRQPPPPPGTPLAN